MADSVETHLRRFKRSQAKPRSGFIPVPASGGTIKTYTRLEPEPFRLWIWPYRFLSDHHIVVGRLSGRVSNW